MPPPIRCFPVAVVLFCAPLVAAADHTVGGEVKIATLAAPVVVDGDLGEWDRSAGKLLTLGMPTSRESRALVPLNAYRAEIAFRYDPAHLYVAAWWCEPTPLGPQTSPGCLPGCDGLVLTWPSLTGATRLAFWRDPAGTASHALIAHDGTALVAGTALADVTQGYRVTGPDRYTQELAIPWTSLGKRPDVGALNRMGVELCFGGLDAQAGYRAWVHDTDTGLQAWDNRWGGGMCWSLADGVRVQDQDGPRFDPADGALVTLMPAGTRAPANPAVAYHGREQTRTTAMICVPAAGITIDGTLQPGEWDAGTATRLASEPTLFPDCYAVDVHWASDVNGLYAGLVWHCGGGHLNINDPACIDHGYDGGDALQIRLGTDQVSHVDVWWHDDTRRPAMNIAYGVDFAEGKLPDALAGGARMALSPTVSAGRPSGYTQELFLPWAHITADDKPLGEGASFRAILNLFFSGLDGNRLPFIINARLGPGIVATAPFTAPEDGVYSVVIVDPASGRTVRNLLLAERLQRGQAVVAWDGRYDAGTAMAPGTYAYRGLRHPGLGLQYLSSYNNPGSPTWLTRDGAGEWGGDYSPPQGVACSGKTVFLGWTGAEGADGVIACGLDGRKQWGFFKGQIGTDTPGGMTLLAVDGDDLIQASEVTRPSRMGETAMAQFRTVLCRHDTATGNARALSPGVFQREIAAHATSDVTQALTWDIEQARSHSLDTWGERSAWPPGRTVGADLAGLAARAGKVYVSLRTRNEILVCTRSDFTEIARWKLDRPAGLAFAADGHLLAISGRTVVRFDDAGTPTPVIPAGLAEPVALAVDTDGSIYVADWGTSQCVKVFANEGQTWRDTGRTIGKPGGRAGSGAYDRNALRLPRGIAVDSAGTVWVVEDEDRPRRVSAWDTRTGELKREFIGGTTVAGAHGGMLDPADPGRAYSDGVWYGITLGSEGYHPLFSMPRRRARADCFGELSGFGCHTMRILPANGRRYLVSSLTGSDRVVIGELKADGSWQPGAAIGRVWAGRQSSDEQSWTREPLPEFFYQHRGENFVWTDGDGDGKGEGAGEGAGKGAGDGLAQESEFVWRKPDADLPSLGAFWGSGAADHDLDLVVASGDGPLVLRFPLQGWTAGGAPRYSFDQVEAVARPTSRFESVAVDREGRVLTILGLGRNAEDQARAGVGLTGYAADGSPRWCIPTSGDPRQPGTITGDGLLGPVDAGGETGEILGLMQWYGLLLPLVTTDGLLLDRLLRDPAVDGTPGPDLAEPETIQYLNRLDDGRIILSHGKNAHNLLQVTGLGEVKRFAGTIELR